MAAAFFSITGSSLPATIAAATSAAAASALSGGVKEVVAAASERRSHWAAFATALSDEITTWRAQELYKPV
jgi:hypothetical protein